jgi:hypothetical protein
MPRNLQNVGTGEVADRSGNLMGAVQMSADKGATPRGCATPSLHI